MDVRGAGVLDDWLADLKYSSRSLSRRPGPTATAVVTLALAIGGNAAVFTVVHSVLLRWPYPDAARLVRMSSNRVIGGRLPAAVPDFDDWKASSSTFDAIAASRGQTVPLDGDLERWFRVLLATAGLTDLVGMCPALGRLLQDGDFRPDAAPVVVLAHQTWTSRFGADPEVLGRTIRLGDALHTVVGVAEPVSGPLFATVDGIAAWSEGPRFDGAAFPSLLGHLKEGTTLAQAQQELDAIGHPSEPVAVFLIDAFVAPVRPTLMVLLGATGLILLIAISNTANLVVARASARHDELSVRAALGAGRGRLARLLLTESLLIAFAGGATGLVLAWAIVGALRSMEPTWIPRLAEIAIGGAAVATTLAVTIVCGLLIGLASLVVLRRVLAGERKASWRATPHDSWLRSGLVVTQVSLSLVLLAGSALTVRSYAALLDVPLGFDYRNIVTFWLGDGGGFSMGPARPEQAVRLQQSRDVLERIRALPGVQAATLTGLTPLSGSSGSTEVELLTGSARGTMPSVQLVAVIEDFFEFVGSRAVSPAGPVRRRHVRRDVPGPPRRARACAARRPRSSRAGSGRIAAPVVRAVAVGAVRPVPARAALLHALAGRTGPARADRRHRRHLRRRQLPRRAQDRRARDPHGAWCALAGDRLAVLPADAAAGRLGHRRRPRRRGLAHALHRESALWYRAHRTRSPSSPWRRC